MSSLVTGTSLHPQLSFFHILNSFNLPSRIACLLTDSIFLLMLCLTVHPHLDRLQKNLGKLHSSHPLASLELGLLFCLCLNECAYPHIVCVHTLITSHSEWPHTYHLSYWVAAVVSVATLCTVRFQAYLSRLCLSNININIFYIVRSFMIGLTVLTQMNELINNED